MNSTSRIRLSTGRAAPKILDPLPSRGAQVKTDAQKRYEEAIAYERYVLRVADGLAAEESGFDGWSSYHDQQFLGFSGVSHQIDILSENPEFGWDDYPAICLIECKKHTWDLSVGYIRNFFGVMHDTGANFGVVVATSNFQSGAEEFAEFYQISTIQYEWKK